MYIIHKRTMKRTYYQNYYFTEEELQFAEEIMANQIKRREELLKNNTTENQHKIKRLDLLIKALKYYHSL